MITSLSNPKIKQIVRLREKARERSGTGAYITEGFKMFEEAPIEDILEVYLSEHAMIYSEKDSGHITLKKDIPLKKDILWKKLEQTGYEPVSHEVFGKMSDTQTPQGILTVLRQRSYRLEELVQKPNPLLILLEDLQDPGNLGTILRTGEGAGITGVIMSRQTVDLFNPKVIRSTMGSIYRVPYVYTDDLQGVIKSLHNIGINTYAAHLTGEACYDEISYRGPTAFLIGNEGSGLRESTANLAKFRIQIPMVGKVESLNASVAAALLMYEGYRQRIGRHNK